jgi:hypothetical protein
MIYGDKKNKNAKPLKTNKNQQKPIKPTARKKRKHKKYALATACAYSIFAYLHVCMVLQF